MTTDIGPKEYAVRVETPHGAFHVGGMAKGAGMIEPLLATMLGFVTTDADVTPALLHRLLESVVDRTFNAITVDGECSTNDTVLALASGASGIDDRKRRGRGCAHRRAGDRLPRAGPDDCAWRRRGHEAGGRARDGRRERGGGQAGRPGPSRTHRS